MNRKDRSDCISLGGGRLGPESSAVERHPDPRPSRCRDLFSQVPCQFVSAGAVPRSAVFRHRSGRRGLLWRLGSLRRLDSTLCEWTSATGKKSRPPMAGLQGRCRGFRYQCRVQRCHIRVVTSSPGRTNRVEGVFWGVTMMSQVLHLIDQFRQLPPCCLPQVSRG